MNLTNNLHLRKPGLTDKAKILDINDNMDSIDAAFAQVGTVVTEALATKAATTTISGNTITTVFADGSKEVSTESENQIVSKKYSAANELFETITTVISENAIKTEVRR